MNRIFLWIFILILHCSIMAQNRTDSLLTALKLTTNEDIRIDILNEIANSELHTNPARSRQFATQALELATKHHDQKGMCESLTRLGWCCRYESDYGGALKCYHSALNLCMQYKDTSNAAMLLNDIAFIHKRTGDFVQAIDYMFQSIRLRELIRDQKNIAYSYDNIASIHNQIKSFDQALSYMEKALKIREELQDQKGTAYSHNRLGRFHFVQGRYESALKEHQIALNIRKGLKLINLEAHSTLQIGVVYQAMQQFQRALQYYNEAKNLFSQRQNNQGLSLCHANIGSIYDQWGNIEKAQEEYSKSLELETRMNDRRGMCEANYRIGRSYLNNSEYKMAQPYIQKGLRIASELNVPALKKDGYELMASLNESANRPLMALNNYKKYFMLQDSLHLVSSKTLTLEVDARYRLDQKNREINLLRGEKALQNSQLNKQKIINTFYLIGSILILGFALLILRAYRQIKITNLKLEEANQKIRKQSSALAEINDKQTELLKKLKETNAAKDRFFSIIAHDLKNPLQTQLSGSRLLADRMDHLHPEDIRSIANEMKVNTKLLFNLLENLLQWARVQTESLQLCKKSVDILESVQKWINFYQHNADQKQIVMKNEISRSCLVSADPLVIDSILNNLISNALKFSNPSGEITLGCKEDNNHFSLTVTDSGVGISPSRLENLFKLDVNISTHGTQDEKGTGLGLILCKEFVELSGGSIQVESTPGLGSKFTVSLPK